MSYNSGIGPAAPSPTPGVKSKACARCRQHKAKCIGGIPCRRCSETGVECTPQVRSGVQPLPDRVARLEADVAKLKALLRASPTSSKSDEVKLEDDEDVTLIDSVRLGKRTRRGTVGGEIREDVALQIFLRRASHFFPFLDPEMDVNAIVKTTLLYWAIVAVGSREAEELSATFELARRRVIDLSAQTMFGPVSKEDLQGLLIVSMWLDQFRIPGHAIAVAHELNLRGTIDKLSTRAQPGNASDQELTDALRLYGYVYMIDRLASMLSGRPRMLPGGNLVAQCRYLLHRPQRRLGDIRLVAQIENCNITGTAVDDFFPDSGIPTGAFNRLPEYNNQMDGWLANWIGYVDRYGPSLVTGEPDLAVIQALRNSLHMIWVATKFSVNTYALRGTDPLHSTNVRECIGLAKDVCDLVIKRYQPPAINYLSNFSQLHVTYAAIFLARIMRVIPEHYDERAISSAKAVADLLCHSSSRYYGERIAAMLDRVTTPSATSQPLWSEDIGEAASFWDWVQQGGGLNLPGSGPGLATLGVNGGFGVQ